MKLLTASFSLLLGTMPTPSDAGHDEGCTMGGADPATYYIVDLGSPTFSLGGGPGVYYVEERSVLEPLNTNPPIPLSGFLLGGGTWVYEEVNWVSGLHRGGQGLVPTVCYPWPFEPYCWDDIDPINDPNCGHGPDLIYL